MKFEDVNINKQVEDFTKKLNNDTLSSIARNGLVPLAQQSEPGNGIFGSNEAPKLLCVNHVSLPARNVKQSSSEYSAVVGNALRTMIAEEYTGVYGISCERKSPYILHSNIDILVAQIQERLNTNILFILNPPTTKTKHNSVIPSTVSEEGVIKAPISVYTANDAASQSQGDIITVGQDTKSSAIIEIKTPFNFMLNKDVIAVMVPEQLYEQATVAFEKTGVRIIKISQTSVCIKKHPEILEKLFKQKLSEKLSVKAPDYAKAIQDYILPKHNQFSLHVVRLAGCFDVGIRYVENLQQNKTFFSQNNIRVVLEKQNSGWCIYHNDRNLEKVSKDELMRIFTSANESLKPKLNSGFTKLNGDFNLTRLPTTEVTSPTTFMTGINSLGIQVVQTYGYLMLAIPKNLSKEKNLLMLIMEIGKQRIEAATKIITWYRGIQLKRISKESISNIQEKHLETNLTRGLYYE